MGTLELKPFSDILDNQISLYKEQHGISNYISVQISRIDLINWSVVQRAFPSATPLEDQFFVSPRAFNKNDFCFDEGRGIDLLDFDDFILKSTEEAPLENSLDSQSKLELRPLRNVVLYIDNKPQYIVRFNTGSFCCGHDTLFYYLIAQDQETALKIMGILSDTLFELQMERREINIWNGNVVTIAKNYTWNDICWDDETINDVKQDIEFFLKRKDWFIKNRLPWKRGLILTGPPGNGKTLLSKVLICQYKLRAYMLDFYDRELETCDLRNMFEEASNKAPCMILLEDLDRTVDKISDNRIPIGLDSLLNTLDGVGEYPGIIVVATANDIDKLDPSLRFRPRRFDRVIEVNNPDFDLRVKFLKKMFMDNINDDTLNILASETKDFSMALIEEIFFKSCSIAIGNNQELPSDDTAIKALNVLKPRGKSIKAGFNKGK